MKRFRLWVVVAVVGHWLLFYFAYFQAVQPWGQRWLFEWVSASLLVLPITVAVAITLFLVGAAKRSVADALIGFSLVAFWGIGLVAFPRVNWWFRSHAIVRVTERARALTEAVRAHERDTGSPPQSLEALIPRHFASVPHTGMGAFPRFEYLAGEKAPAGESWAIQVQTPLGFLNWDILLYLPSGTYPEQGWGGRLERIGDWAYVHE